MIACVDDLCRSVSIGEYIFSLLMYNKRQNWNTIPPSSVSRLLYLYTQYPFPFKASTSKADYYATHLRQTKSNKQELCHCIDFCLLLVYLDGSTDDVYQEFERVLILRLSIVWFFVLLFVELSLFYEHNAENVIKMCVLCTITK